MFRSDCLMIPPLLSGSVGQQLTNDPIHGVASNTILDSQQLYPSPKKFEALDPIFSEIGGNDHISSKRAAWDFYAMVKCATGCNPLVFKGYGCFCGFLGSGEAVDGIDRCCKMHDWCYTTTNCMRLQHTLPYFVPYKWKCNGGAPYCSELSICLT